MGWVKCSCGRVVPDDEQHECPGAPAAPKRKRSSSAASVAAHRAKTGNAYGKAYAKARASAVAALIAMHPEDFAAQLEKARIDVGLGPTAR